MMYADSKTIAEHALRVLRGMEKLAPQMQAEVLSVAFSLVNVAVQRANFQQQQARREVSDE